MSPILPYINTSTCCHIITKQAIEARDTINLPVCLLVSQKTRHPVYKIVKQASRADQRNPASDGTVIRSNNSFLSYHHSTHYLKYIRHTTSISTQNSSTLMSTRTKLRMWHQLHTLNRWAAVTLMSSSYCKCRNCHGGNIHKSAKKLAALNFLGFNLLCMPTY